MGVLFFVVLVGLLPLLRTRAGAGSAQSLGACLPPLSNRVGAAQNLLVSTPGRRYDLSESGGANGGGGMNIFKALAVKDVDEATQAIPLIDVGPAFRAEPRALEGAAREVRRACETVGFFYLAGHGVPQALIDAAFAASREFHAMPLESKRALTIKENNIGYLAVNESMQ